MKYFKILRFLFCALAALTFTVHAHAATLFGATAAGGPGELYILNPTTGAVVQDVGPLNDLLGANYGVTGLAFNPVTGLLYGSTANSDVNTAAKLISINPATALVTVIGDFNAGNAGKPATMADIAFNPNTGGLFGVGSVGGPQLYSISLATGQATLIGGTGLTSTSGGGLAISAGGIYYGAPTPSRFGTYDPVLGTYSNISNPVKPVGGAYGALSFDENGVLFGLNVGAGGPPPTHIVTFDLTTGVITDIGASVTSLDAIAFAPVPEPSTIAILGIGVAALVVRRRQLRSGC
jgi:hypothetical protein